MSLLTTRLRLRPLQNSDAPRIAVLAGDWDVASMTGRVPFPYSAEAATHWLTGLAPGEIVYGIEHNAELIGICGYTLARNGSAEIGYWIGKDYWGKGFATEAATRLIEHGFSAGGVKRFVCSHFAENLASKRVIAKLGFMPRGAAQGWCEARNCEMPTFRYLRRRPWRLALRALAS
jgi:RimJ/RimL family protein N-acetyltransferase